MIRIDEEVEPVIRIPIELMEYVELEEGKLEIVKPVPQDLQPLVIELQGNYRKKQDPTDQSTGGQIEWITEYKKAL